MRKKFIGGYWNKIDVFKENSYKKYGEFYLCPCCCYPTLSNRGEFEVCRLCDWEDDGQDDFNASEILGGPNSDYSLEEARHNFQNTYTIYRKSDTQRYNLDIGHKSFSKMASNRLSIKKSITDDFDLLYETRDKERRRNIISRIYSQMTLL